MAGEVTAVIDLCTLVADVGLKAYNAAQKISTNFEEERKSLGERVKEMRQRVDRLREELEKDQTHNLKGIKEVLEDIKSEFKKIEKFFIKLDGYGDLRGLKWLLQKIKNFRSVERKFEDFNSNLEELQKKLAENIPEGILKVVLGNNQIILDVREQQAAIIKIQQRDQYKMRELLKDNAALQENLRLVTDRTTYIQKRVAVDFNIKPDELTDETALAAGSFCDYSTAMLDGEKVVVKRVRDVKDSFVHAKFARETRNLIHFSRGSIIRMFGMWDGQDEKYVVLEYMEKGTLKKLLKEEENLSLENKLTLALTAARSLSRMHTTLVHTALRTDKFLVDKDYTAKLSGMGYAMTFSSCRRFVGADRLDDLHLYRAPEHYRPQRPSKEADIYGFGIVLWEILTQTKPFSSKLGDDPTEDDVRKFLLETKGEEYDLSKLEDPAMFDLSLLVKQCRAIDPKERPNVSDIEKTLSKIYEDFSKRQNQTDELSNGGVEI
ncbi:putative mitogen-activated protein kinase kinase kinase 7-like [Apostichopus japonicus]|uniref:putative mitogen-activated protein kinase kinase kinase 7-like n=1 Tax=Stichopus japonicus TaxID=307972 RepID=UPI003AB282F2